MATHSNGISALQLQKQLGIGSYRSAWLLAHKLRASMVDPERNPLSGLVEIDEASLPFRTKDASHRRARRTQATTARCSSPAPSNSGTETSQAACGRPKSPPTAPPTSDTSSKPPPIPTPSRKPTAGAGYAAVPAESPQCPCRREDRRSPRPAVDPCLLQPQRMGARRLPRAASQALQAYLDEFVFRFNRRKTRHAAFRSLFRLATNAEPLTYSMLIEPEPCARSR